MLSIRLEVPTEQGFWQADNAGFVLLPGFEHLPDAHWQQLMRLVLVTSTSVVIVTDRDRLANASQNNILGQLQGGDLHGANPVEVVLRLNRCDFEDGEAIDQIVDTASTRDHRPPRGHRGLRRHRRTRPPAGPTPSPRP